MIVGNYQDMISHYDHKLGYAEDEWETAGRQLMTLNALLESGWQGDAGRAALEKTEEFGQEFEKIESGMEQIRASLAALGLALEEEMRRLSKD